MAGIAVAVLAMAVFVGVTVVTGKTPSTATSTHNMALEAMHIHPHLEVIMDGKPITVPVNIGISSELYKDHSLDQYAGMHGMAPLHTHSDDGTIHVESSVVRDYTLGEFLDIWGLNIGGNSVTMTVDGQPISDFRNHVLADREQIVLEVKT